jgi:hypothetical protein
MVPLLHAVMLGPDDPQRLLAILQRIFPDLVDDVAAETVDAAVKPEAKDAFHFFQNAGAPPIEIGLLDPEDMQIPGSGGRHISPSAPAEIAGPVVGGQGIAFFPDPPKIIIAIRAIGFLGFKEPFVLIGGMIDHEIHHHSDAPFLGFGDEKIHVRQGPEFRIDILIIGDIIAIIGVGGFIDWGEPNDADSEVFEIIEFGENAFDIADAVAVAVAIRTRIDLINGVVTEIFLIHETPH